jgi:two-component system invasion response regulator UvrY
MNTPDLITIALADDHTIMRKALVEMINNFGEFRVITDAVHGQELIDKIQLSGEVPDVCIVDIKMPVMDGYETVKQLKKNWPNVKILALSMYDSEFNIIRMLTNGANGYVLKENDPQELREAMLSVHYKTFYHSELVSGRLIHVLHRGAGAELNISDKEMEFLSYCCSELSYKEIAQRMNLSNRTIEGYRDVLFNKIKVRTRPGLVVYALKVGLEPLGG